MVKPLMQEKLYCFCHRLDSYTHTFHRVVDGLLEFTHPIHMCFVVSVLFNLVPCSGSILWEVLWATRAGIWFRLRAVTPDGSQ